MHMTCKIAHTAQVIVWVRCKGHAKIENTKNKWNMYNGSNLQEAKL